MDSWKLGFIMGKVSVHGKGGKARIIEFVKGDQTCVFHELSDLLSICKDEFEIKTGINILMRDMGIETEIEFKDFTSGKRVAGMGGF